MATPSFHLRRIVYKEKSKQNSDQEFILLGLMTKFGRNENSVDVVLTSAVYSNMISRDHAVISGKVDQHGNIVDYSIKDNSLNGTYINDQRVNGEMSLKNHDVIKFGHMNGAAIKPGTNAPQVNAEFSFSFEEANYGHQKYIGWEGKIRVATVQCTGDGRPMIIIPRNNTIRKNDSRIVTNVSSMKEDGVMHQPIALHHQHDPSTFAQLPFSHLQHVFGQRSMAHPHFNMSSPNLTLQQQQQYLAHQMSNTVMSNGRNGHQVPNISSTIQHSQPMHQHIPTPSSTVIEAASSSTSSYPSSTHHIHPSSSSIQPSSIRSPIVECDSSVPSPPKTNCIYNTSNTVIPDSSSGLIGSPRRDIEDDSFSVPDSPPRAPRPHDVSGRSVTNSPVPPSPKRIEKGNDEKEKEKEKEEVDKDINNTKKATPSKKGGKGSKTSNGGVGSGKSREVAQLLNDVTESSFMATLRRKSVGAGSERRRLQDEGKKTKKEVSKNKLLQQLSDPSSDEDSDDDEEEEEKTTKSVGVSRKSLTGSKPLSNSSRLSIGVKRKGGRDSDEDDESDPYEDTDSDNDDIKKKKKKITTSNTSKNTKTTAKGPAKKASTSSKKNIDNDDDDDEEDDTVVDSEYVDSVETLCAAASKCVKPKSTKVNWICCEICDSWYHVPCQSDLPHNITLKQIEDTTWYCPPCKMNPKIKKKKKTK